MSISVAEFSGDESPRDWWAKGREKSESELLSAMYQTNPMDEASGAEIVTERVV